MLYFWASVLLSCVVTTVGQRAPVLEFHINLDVAPQSRFAGVNAHFSSSIHAFYKAFLSSFPAKAALFGLATARGTENDELQGEIEGVAQQCAVPLYGVQAIQMLYELQTLMVPVVNFSIPWRGPGCTGILALNKADGMVYHARNLDFTPAKYMQDLVYVGVFHKAGEELFRAQMVAGYSFPLTAMRAGLDGYTFSVNTRYLDHVGGNAVLLKNLLVDKVEFSGWTRRKVLENVASYGDAVEAFSTTKYVSSEYNVIGGVKKGTILARNPEGLAYKMTLGQENFECRNDYIIVTNFDYVYHDVREWFDPTGGKGIFHPRRLAAQRLLNNSAALTPEVLFSTIDDFEVMAKETIFQATMSVEAGLWNVSLPACTSCGRDAVVV